MARMYGDVCLMNFANIAEIEKKAGKLDFVLADLGVSSMQIDDPKARLLFSRRRTA